MDLASVRQSGALVERVLEGGRGVSGRVWFIESGWCGARRGIVAPCPRPHFACCSSSPSRPSGLDAPMEAAVSIGATRGRASTPRRRRTTRSPETTPSVPTCDPPRRVATSARRAVVISGRARRAAAARRICAARCRAQGSRASSPRTAVAVRTAWEGLAARSRARRVARAPSAAAISSARAACARCRRWTAVVTAARAAPVTSAARARCASVGAARPAAATARSAARRRVSVPRA